MIKLLRILFMKRYILLFIILITLSNIAVSQLHSSDKLRLGARFDPLVSWIKSDNNFVESDGIRLGIGAGLQLDYYFEEQYAISTGLYINSVGGKLLFNNSVPFSHAGMLDTLPENTSMKYKLQYIEIPLNLKLISRQIGNTKYFASLGFSPQINIKATADASALNDSNSYNFNDEIIKEELSLFNLSYIIGVGVELEVVGNTSLILGAFYKNGFTDITRDHEDGIIDIAGLKNIGISIGLLF